MLNSFSWHTGETISLPPGKLVCVGRNYVAHAAELGNAVPDEPLLFIKPNTALTPLSPGFSIPTDRGSVHHETELALLVGRPLRRASVAEAQEALLGIGLALDLTLRDTQAELKKLSHPWEKAKAFDGSAPLSPFWPIAEFPDLKAIRFTLESNGERRQSGDSGQMIWDMLNLTAYISHHFTLLPGDLILTGTPAGVGPLQPGDSLQLQLADHPPLLSLVSAEPATAEHERPIAQAGAS